jgi:hypothetical protein
MGTYEYSTYVPVAIFFGVSYQYRFIIFVGCGIFRVIFLLNTWISGFG